MYCIVILSYNSNKLTIDLVNSLMKQNVSADIYISECSSEGNYSIIKNSLSNIQQVKVIKSINAGYYWGNYYILKDIKDAYDYAYIMNPDISSDNWYDILNILYKNHSDNTRFFAASCKILIPGSKDVSSPKLFSNVYIEILKNFLFPFSYFFDRAGIKIKSMKTGNVFAVEGSFILVDILKYIYIKDIFKNHFLYNEEFVFGTISRSNNWVIHFNSDLHIYHHHQPRKENSLFDIENMNSLINIIENLGYSKLRNIMKASLLYKLYMKKIIYRLIK